MLLKLGREPWNPWPNLSPLGAPASGLERKTTKTAGDDDTAPGATAPRFQVLCWSRAADGTIDRVALTSEL